MYTIKRIDTIETTNEHHRALIAYSIFNVFHCFRPSFARIEAPSNQKLKKSETTHTDVLSEDEI